MITEAEFVKFASHYSYASVGGVSDVYIEVPVLKWPEFLKR